MNRKSQILDELSQISIHLQYMPTSLDNSPQNQKYFDYFKRALALRNELNELENQAGEGS